ncbi:MAG: DUF5034 domain-containing protein [Ferruginibacter sp.]
MKFRNKIIFILLFPLVCDMVVSCCHCDDAVIKYYTNKTIALDHLDNSGQNPVVAATGSVLKNAYGIRLKIIREETACIKKHSSFFMESAYATSCSCPPLVTFKPKNSVVSMKFYTINDFDNLHSAGAEITEYFKAYEKFVFTAIPDYLEKINEVLNSTTEFELAADFLLTTAPAIGTDHIFKIQLLLSDGRTMELETTQISLI